MARAALPSLVLAIIMFAGCASGPGLKKAPENIPVPDTLALELGEWDEASRVLLEQSVKYPESPDIAYYLGLSYLGKLNSVRGDGQSLQPMGMLGREEEHLLSEALVQFRRTIELKGSGEVTAKALYLSGQCLDIGNLQRFEEALEFYKSCSEGYPETEAGWRCLERYGQLKEKFDGIERGSHGIKP